MKCVINKAQINCRIEAVLKQGKDDADVHMGRAQTVVLAVNPYRDLRTQRNRLRRFHTIVPALVEEGIPSIIASLGFAFITYHARSIPPAAAIHFVVNFLFAILGMVFLVMS